MRDTKPSFLNLQIGSHSKIAVIVAKWNNSYNDEMLQSAQEVLLKCGLAENKLERFEVPGAFEIPVLALKLAKTKHYDAIICFATIIKGSTYHFEIVANESARGIMDVMLQTGVPVLNGILACNTTEQAELRASKLKEDKGKEVALSAIALINELQRV